MNNTIKISLTINGIEGSTLVRRSEAEILKYSYTEREMNPRKKFRGKEGLNVVRKGKVKYWPLEAVPASQHINMTKEAYDYMISSNCPAWFHKPKEWKRFNQTQRLECHLARTCQHFKGTSYSYIILED